MKSELELSGPGPGPAPGQSPDSVLIAEDDPIFRHILQSWLQRWNYRVTAVSNGIDAWKALQEKNAPKMAVLDWMMPGMDGIELCRKIRQAHGPYRYLLLLTAKDNKQDVVAGLDAGADDYLIKPFDIDELSARLRAVTRRVSGSAETLLAVGEVVLDLRQRVVTCRGQPAALTAREYALVELLMRKAGCLLTRAEIQEELYGFEDHIASNAIEVHIHNLRRKLGAHFITNLKGRGYRVDSLRGAPLQPTARKGERNGLRG